MKEEETIKLSESPSPHICESDGMEYLSYPPQWRCKICGRFEFAHSGKIKPQMPDYNNFK